MQPELARKQRVIHANSSLDTPFPRSMDQRRNPNSLIDMSELLFKPLSLLQILQIPTQPLMQPPLSDAARIGSILQSAERELCDKLPERREAIISRVQTQKSPQISTMLNGTRPNVSDPQVRPIPGVLQDQPTMLTLAFAPTRQSKTRPSRLGELLWYVLGAGMVVTMFMVTPLVTTLIPLLPTDWSRLLITLELLGVGELAIGRILMNTITKK